MSGQFGFQILLLETSDFFQCFVRMSAEPTVSPDPAEGRVRALHRIFEFAYVVLELGERGERVKGFARLHLNEGLEDHRLRPEPVVRSEKVPRIIQHLNEEDISSSSHGRAFDAAIRKI